jgi:hypothetical protein
MGNKLVCDKANECTMKEAINCPHAKRHDKRADCSDGTCEDSMNGLKFDGTCIKVKKKD